jgi:hypothetical protein
MTSNWQGYRLKVAIGTRQQSPAGSNRLLGPDSADAETTPILRCDKGADRDGVCWLLAPRTQPLSRQAYSRPCG